MATISQRISLEGGDDVRKALEDLGKAGEKSFKQIQDAAEKTKVDPARFQQAQKAISDLITTGTQLGNKFQELAQAATAFGTQGADAARQVTTGLNATNDAAAQAAGAMAKAGQQADNVGRTVGASLISGATAFKIAAAGVIAAVGAMVSALTKGAAETGAKIADQAEKLKLSTEQWVQLRTAIAGTGGSSDDFAKSLEQALKVLDKAKGEAAEVSKVFTVMGENGKQVSVVNTNLQALAKAMKDGDLATVKLFNDLGIALQTLQTGDPLTILRTVAEAINKMPEGAAKAAAGVKFFGDSWKDTIKALLAAKTATIDTADTMAKKGRELSADQVEMGKKVTDAWKDLGAAIRATRDQIGAVFLPGQLAKTEWLTKLVDDSRELLKTWLGLGEAGRSGFLKDLAGDETPAATAFKILLEVGNQLAGLWNDVLVPAGEKLGEMIGQIADSFEGVSKSQVAAFFITATIAAIGLAVALKGIGFVLSPITTLISLFVSLSPILIPLIVLVALFWDQLKEGAQTVAALVPGALEKVSEAIKALFAGDFAGAWAKFSEAAVEAFKTISDEAMKVPWVKTLVDGFKEIGQQIPGTIKLIAEALISLGQVAEGAATSLNRIFGTQLTGTDVAAIAIIAQYTGALQALGSAATVVAATFTTLGVIIGGIGVVFGSTAAAIAVGVIGIIAAGIAIAVFWDQLVAHAKSKADEVVAAFKDIGNNIAQAVTDWVTTPVSNAWAWIVDTFKSALDGLGSAISAAYGAIVEFVTTPVASAWQWIKDTFNAMISSLGFSSGGAVGGGGGGDGFAGGGLLGGRGTGTSDSNLAWVSRGEYITPARAVAQPGVLAFLEALRRSGGNLRNVLDGMGRFALGGLVAPTLSIPALAGGGMNSVTINFPGLPEITGLRASSDVVDQLRKAAAMSQVRSGGRKPSRYS